MCTYLQVLQENILFNVTDKLKHIWHESSKTLSAGTEGLEGNKANMNPIGYSHDL